MSSFAKATFDTAAYLANRPTYPARVYEVISQFHSRGGQYDHAIDLGCGPGFIALELANRFREVTGLDPAAKMVEVGLQPNASSKAERITYTVGSAEDLAASGIADGSIDLVTAGQAAHWFDHTKAWKELHRILKPGGTVAYIAYAEVQLPSRPDLNQFITHLSSSPEALGPHWSQPGRSIVEGLLDKVPFPVQPTTPNLQDLPGFPIPVKINEPEPTGSRGWDSSTAVRIKTSSAEGQPPWLMRKKLSWSNFGAYFRTWSALHSYHEAHPEDRALGEEGDIVGRMVNKLRQEFGEVEGVEVGWPLSVVMIKKENA